METLNSSLEHQKASGRENVEPDGYWDEPIYRMPSKVRLKKERQAYEEAEREDKEHELI